MTDRLPDDTPAGRPTVYQPGDPDPLRDGLLRGFLAHRARLEAGEVWPSGKPPD
jgi:hypothetical protein